MRKIAFSPATDPAAGVPAASSSWLKMAPEGGDADGDAELAEGVVDAGREAAALDREDADHGRRERRADHTDGEHEQQARRDQDQAGDERHP